MNRWRDLEPVLVRPRDLPEIGERVEPRLEEQHRGGVRIEVRVVTDRDSDMGLGGRLRAAAAAADEGGPQSALATGAEQTGGPRAWSD